MHQRNASLLYAAPLSASTPAVDAQHRKPSHQSLLVASSPVLSSSGFAPVPASSSSYTKGVGARPITAAAALAAEERAAVYQRRSSDSKLRRGSKTQKWTQRVMRRVRKRTVLGLVAAGVALYLYLRTRSDDHSEEDKSSKGKAPESKSWVNETIVERIVYRSDPATASCNPCILNPLDPLCVYGIDNVRLSRSYEGSGYRVRKVMEKALRGEQVTIGVLGASVTTGHGLDGKPKWQDVFVEDFVKMFPRTKVYDGAQAGMNSDFFAFCYNALVPSSLDLYLIELDINNDPVDKTYHDDDALYRGLLGLPQQPAVLRVQVFALMFNDMARGAISSQIMSTFHDVPIVGIRNWLLPHLVAHPEEIHKYFAQEGKDTRHIGVRSHKALGDMLAIYFREQVCETKRIRSAPPKGPRARPGDWPSTDILKNPSPNQYIWTPFDPSEKVLRLEPSCSLASSTLRPLIPISTNPPTQFSKIDWNDKYAWASHTIGHSITLPFHGTRVGLFVWSHDGKASAIGPGICYCYLDGVRERGAHINAWVPDPFAHSRFNLVFEELEPADHTITCEILDQTSSGGHDFRILGIGSQ